MKNKIIFSDITLRESEQINATGLSFREKLELAKLLEKLNVDVIETGFVGDMHADSVLVKTIAGTINNSIISVPVPLSEATIERSWEMLSCAQKPRLNIIVPTSTVQMEYTYQLKADKLLKRVADIAAKCTALCADVEITAEDASRSERNYLMQVISTAIQAGVKTVTLCDSTGQLLPEEAVELIEWAKANIAEINGITLGIHFKDELGLAASAALAVAEAGVTQIKTTFNGLGANLSMEQFVRMLKTREDTLELGFNVNHTTMQRTCKQMEAIIGMNRTSRTVFGHVLGTAETEDNIKKESLTAEADLLSVRRRIESLGYDLSDTDMERVYSHFCRIVAKKKVVEDRDLEAMVAETAHQVAPTYQLINYVINSGSSISATAFVRLDKQGETLQSVSYGDGPIDAAFLAIEQVLGVHFELEDFQIQAVTEGREAMGDALVKLRNNGKLYSGRGISTDIIGASVRAYLNAVNKIVNEEKAI